ncbi:MAG: glucose-6-phosphate dehydrogenase (NADP(+)) [Fibrobacter sp.]|nr:glucose-6-phosphate dehydrogenase (NADP(+)) [Fibrobacter sp.]
MVSLSQSAIVILGASGDLTKRKLMPALDALYTQGKICQSCIIVGTGRSFFTDQSFRDRFDVSPGFKENLFYHQHTEGLREFLLSKGEFEKIVFFLSQPPEAYGASARELHAEGFRQEASLVIEKPFGYDFLSARKLDLKLTSYFSESQIFRIDHYLAKEPVQNILVFRFANPAFHPVWNSRYIQSIQINALESNGIIERGAYFDHAGIIRDMVQNHLIQLLSLLTMDAPATLSAEDIRVQKIAVLKTMKIEKCYRYQYEGYRYEHDVNPSSTTETFAEIQLSINNLQWAGTPVFIRSGKSVHRRGTEIGVVFKPLPNILFNKDGNLKPNQIIFKIQPAEGIILDINTKTPGSGDELADTHMNFCYRDSFKDEIPEAYQRLLYDALRGDHTLFVSGAETEAAWALFDSVLDKGDITEYPRGQLPQSKLNVSWIDFDKYSHFCV